MKIFTRQCRFWLPAMPLATTVVRAVNVMLVIRLVVTLVVTLAVFAPAARSEARSEARNQAGSEAATLPSSNIQAAIEKFLATQTAGLPGKVRITLYAPPSGPLPRCDVPEPFLPSGARLWGRVSVGVRCAEGAPWTRYVQASVAVVARYYVAARQLDAGETLTLVDAAIQEGDVTALPASVIVDPAQLNGVTVLNRIALGAPIRREFLRAVAVVQQGQNIKLITQGPGFVVSTEGKAMTSAAVGSVVQAKTQSGQLISGVVRADGVVERAN